MSSLQKIENTFALFPGNARIFYLFTTAFYAFELYSSCTESMLDTNDVFVLHGGVEAFAGFAFFQQASLAACT